MCCFSNSAETDNFNGDCMIQVELSFEGSQGNIDKFVADSFPARDEDAHIHFHGGDVSELIAELGSVYNFDASSNGVYICFIRSDVDSEWFEEINHKLTVLGMANIYLDYADEHGECAGYMGFRNGVLFEEHFNGEDISEVSEELLGVLETWDTMSYLFDDADDADDADNAVSLTLSLKLRVKLI